jgi:hypothetical protein
VIRRLRKEKSREVPSQSSQAESSTQNLPESACRMKRSPGFPRARSRRIRLERWIRFRGTHEKAPGPRIVASFDTRGWLPLSAATRLPHAGLPAGWERPAVPRTYRTWCCLPCAGTWAGCGRRAAACDLPPTWFGAATATATASVRLRYVQWAAGTQSAGRLSLEPCTAADLQRRPTAHAWRSCTAYTWRSCTAHARGGDTAGCSASFGAFQTRAPKCTTQLDV